MKQNVELNDLLVVDVILEWFYGLYIVSAGKLECNRNRFIEEIFVNTS